MLSENVEKELRKNGEVERRRPPPQKS